MIGEQKAGQSGRTSLRMHHSGCIIHTSKQKMQKIAQ
jgi:hypothetical protein